MLTQVSKEQIPALLKDCSAEWTDRRDALHAIRGIVQASSKAYILSYITEIQPLICIQLDDRRSIYCKEVCDLISLIARTLQEMVEPISAGFMTALFQLLVVTIRVIAESAHKCILTILPYATSSIPAISQGVKDKHPFLRASCTGYMCRMLEITPADKLNNESYLQAIDESIRSAIGDSNAEARALAKRTYQSFNKTFPEHAQKLLASLESSLQKRLVETSSKPAPRKGFAEFLAQKQGPKPVVDTEAVITNDIIVVSPRKHTDDNNDKDGSNAFSSGSSTGSSSPSTSSTSTSSGTTNTSSTATNSPTATQSHSLSLAAMEPISLDMGSEPQPLVAVPTEPIVEPVIAKPITEQTERPLTPMDVTQRPLTPMDVSQRPITPTEAAQRPLTPMEITTMPFEPVSPVAASPDIAVAVEKIEEPIQQIETQAEVVEAITASTLAEVVALLATEVAEASVSEAIVEPVLIEEPETSAPIEPVAFFEISVAEAPTAVEVTELAITVPPVSINMDLTSPVYVTPEVDVETAEVTHTTTESETALNMQPEQSVLTESHSSVTDKPALSELLSETEQAPAPLPSGKRATAAKPLSTTTTKTTKTKTKPTTTTTTTATKQPLKPTIPTATKPTIRSTTPALTTRASTPTITTRSSTPTIPSTKATSTKSTTTITTKVTKATTTTTTKREPLKARSNEQVPAAEPAKTTKRVTRTASEDKENQINTISTDSHPPAKKPKVAPPPAPSATVDTSIALRVKTRRAATATTSTTNATTKSTSTIKTVSKPSTTTKATTISTSKTSKSASKRPTWV